MEGSGSTTLLTILTPYNLVCGAPATRAEKRGKKCRFRDGVGVDQSACEFSPFWARDLAEGAWAFQSQYGQIAFSLPIFFIHILQFLSLFFLTVVSYSICKVHTVLLS
jgi:hypothetical protein